MEQFVYIWNTEYEVLVSISHSEEQARLNLVNTWKNTKKIELIEEKDKNSITIPTYVLHRAKVCIDDVDQIIEVFKNPADIVLSVNKQESRIYNHSNE